MEFAIRLHWLRNRWKSGTLTCRTFNLGLRRGWLFIFDLSGRLSWRTRGMQNCLQLQIVDFPCPIVCTILDMTFQIGPRDGKWRD
jgi:hypothetical protein